MAMRNQLNYVQAVRQGRAVGRLDDRRAGVFCSIHPIQYGGSPYGAHTICDTNGNNCLACDGDNGNCQSVGTQKRPDVWNPIWIFEPHGLQ